MSGRSTTSGRPQRRAVAHRLIEGRDEKATIALEEPFDVLAVDRRNVDHYRAATGPGSATGGDHSLETLADISWQDHLILVHHGELIRRHYPATGGGCDAARGGHHRGFPGCGRAPPPPAPAPGAGSHKSP